MKQITISFCSCCLPDYFGGHHKPVLQYPVDGTTTRKDVCSGLLSELAEGVIDYEIEQNNLDYDAIREAINACLYFDDKCKDSDVVFPSLEIWEDDTDVMDSCYAFFVVDWSK